MSNFPKGHGQSGAVASLLRKFRFAEYLMQLSAWASQASLDFAAEIMDASRWPETIAWQKLSTEQRSRSTRLLGILKTAFASMLGPPC